MNHPASSTASAVDLLMREKKISFFQQYNDILPVQTTPSKSPLPETDSGEDLLNQPQMSVNIIHNVLHVEKLPA